MRRDRKSKIKRERMIMVASSALVMGALTMTGIYIKGQSEQNTDDGYSVDFSALEDSIDDKAQEIAQNQQESNTGDTNLAAGTNNVGDQAEINLAEGDVLEDDLDYDPAGSSLIQIPGLTDGIAEAEEVLEGGRKHDEGASDDTANSSEGNRDESSDGSEQQTAGEAGEQKNGQEQKPQKSAENTSTDGSKDTAASNVTVEKTLNFAQEQGLVRPVAGEILMHYSMDSSIYFATLDQYKYNPAVMLSATEGESVTVCADGKVVSVFEDTQIGQAVTLDLGNGYQATYGQLKDVQATEGSYVNQGEVLGSVAAPTKYFAVEGTNLYFKLTKDGQPVNPEELFR